MKFNIQDSLKFCLQDPVVGNVYNVRGGTGVKNGHMMVIVSVNDRMTTVLVLNKQGDIIGGSNYGVHYFEEKCPIAYCPNLEDLTFDIRSIG